MPSTRPTLRLLGASLFALTTTVCPLAAFGQQATQVADAVWKAAHSGKDEMSLVEPLLGADDAALGNGATALRASANALKASEAKRESDRVAQIAKVEVEFEKILAEEQTPANLSKALRSAVELHMLAADKPAFLQQQRIQDLIKRAAEGARQAEGRAEWLMANELFVRLNALLEEQGAFKADAHRVANRLGMIRLYAPLRFWELRNARRLQEGMKPLPAYNATGEESEGKLKGVTQSMVMNAISRSAERHVERVPMRTLLSGALENVKTLATTHDLDVAFPGIANQAAEQEFLDFIDQKLTELRAAQADPDNFELNNIVSDVLAKSRKTVKIPDNAILHEMGNGAFDKLDEFSAIIWPDELPRFRRLMEGEFTGIGVQIQMDDETQMIKVISPLEGTPAFRAGIKAGDLFKKINEQSAIGMNLDQAVEQITGKAGTRVHLTMERDKQDVEFELVRARIPLQTVKGWKREGSREDQWNWFIDSENKIGYVRLTSFQDKTTDELIRAIAQMKGLKGLILDLRFNPGGLLDQAVRVSNVFVDSGLIVSTKDSNGQETESQSARASGSIAAVKDIPIVVLINEGSASASEIVSGALKYYGDQGKIRCVLLGARSFGKGSVQTVVQLSSASMLKLTMAYYYLPNGDLIHRREGAKDWGVHPHRMVEMLPRQIEESLRIRQDADTPLAFGQDAKVDPKPVAPDAGGGDRKDGQDAKTQPKSPPDPERLLTEGIDLQLQEALYLLQTQVVGQNAAAVMKPAKAG